MFDVIAGSYHRGEGMPPTGLDLSGGYTGVLTNPLQLQGNKP